jgi:LysR family transcriptional regulator, cys regulon transcriptional activator
MKLRQLQCLCAVVDAGFNISRAAATLHATQPAVGQQLRQLEQEVGIDLLLRQRGRPVALTPAGERTIGWARRSLQCAENFRAAARSTRGGDAGGTIALLTTHTIASYLLPAALVAFTAAFPRIHVSVLQGLHDQVGQLVRDAKVSFGLTHQPRDVPADVVAVPFRTLELALVAPAGHPLLRRRELTLERIAAYPLIAQNPWRPQGAGILARFREAGLELDLRIDAPDADAVKSYVRAGLGVAVIPAFTYSAQADRGLRIRDASHLFDASVAAVLLKRDSHLPDYVYAFLEMLEPALQRRRIESLVFGHGPAAEDLLWDAKDIRTGRERPGLPASGIHPRPPRRPS